MASQTLSGGHLPNRLREPGQLTGCRAYFIAFLPLFKTASRAQATEVAHIFAGEHSEKLAQSLGRYGMMSDSTVFRLRQRAR